MDADSIESEPIFSFLLLPLLLPSSFPFSPISGAQKVKSPAKKKTKKKGWLGGS